jgi:hypothetical protein
MLLNENEIIICDYVGTVSYERWLEFLFFNHKSSKKGFFGGPDMEADELSKLDRFPEDISFVEAKLEEYYGVNPSLFKDVDKFIIGERSFYDDNSPIISVLFKDNEKLKKFLAEKKNFVPYSFLKVSINDCNFAVRGLINNETEIVAVKSISRGKD